MAIAGGTALMLNLRRSVQSGPKTMTAAWQVVYTENTLISTIAYIFAGAEINLLPMQAGDTIDIRVRKILVPGGAWVNHAQTQYVDAQPAGHPSIHINPIPDVYGVEIAMRQVGGVLRSIDFEAYDAKRLGLS